MKVMTVVGTRPEIIRLSRVIARLDAPSGRPRARAHRPELRPPAQPGLLRRPRAARAGPLPRRRHLVSLGAVLGGTLIETEQVLVDGAAGRRARARRHQLAASPR